MPLLDSLQSIIPDGSACSSVAKTMNTPHGDAITVFDLRFTVPNKEVMPEEGSIPWSTCLLVLCVTILTVMA